MSESSTPSSKTPRARHGSWSPSRSKAREAPFVGAQSGRTGHALVTSGGGNGEAHMERERLDATAAEHDHGNDHRPSDIYNQQAGPGYKLPQYTTLASTSNVTEQPFEWDLRSHDSTDPSSTSFQSASTPLQSHPANPVAPAEPLPVDIDTKLSTDSQLNIHEPPIPFTPPTFLTSDAAAQPQNGSNTTQPHVFGAASATDLVAHTTLDLHGLTEHRSSLSDPPRGSLEGERVDAPAIQSKAGGARNRNPSRSPPKVDVSIPQKTILSNPFGRMRSRSRSQNTPLDRSGRPSVDRELSIGPPSSHPPSPTVDKPHQALEEQPRRPLYSCEDGGTGKKSGGRWTLLSGFPSQMPSDGADDGFISRLRKRSSSVGKPGVGITAPLSSLGGDSPARARRKSFDLHRRLTPRRQSPPPPIPTPIPTVHATQCENQQIKAAVVAALGQPDEEMQRNSGGSKTLSQSDMAVPSPGEPRALPSEPKAGYLLDSAKSSPHPPSPRRRSRGSRSSRSSRSSRLSKDLSCSLSPTGRVISGPMPLRRSHYASSTSRRSTILLDSRKSTSYLGHGASHGIGLGRTPSLTSGATGTRPVRRRKSSNSNSLFQAWRRYTQSTEPPKVDDVKLCRSSYISERDQDKRASGSVRKRLSKKLNWMTKNGKSRKSDAEVEGSMKQVEKVRALDKQPEGPRAEALMDTDKTLGNKRSESPKLESGPEPDDTQADNGTSETTPGAFDAPSSLPDRFSFGLDAHEFQAILDFVQNAKPPGHRSSRASFIDSRSSAKDTRKRLSQSSSDPVDNVPGSPAISVHQSSSPIGTLEVAAISLESTTTAPIPTAPGASVQRSDPAASLHPGERAPPVADKSLESAFTAPRRNWETERHLKQGRDLVEEQRGNEQGTVEDEEWRSREAIHGYARETPPSGPSTHTHDPQRARRQRHSQKGARSSIVNSTPPAPPLTERNDTWSDTPPDCPSSTSAQAALVSRRPSKQSRPGPSTNPKGQLPPAKPNKLRKSPINRISSTQNAEASVVFCCDLDHKPLPPPPLPSVLGDVIDEGRAIEVRPLDEIAKQASVGLDSTADHPSQKGMPCVPMTLHSEDRAQSPQQQHDDQPNRSIQTPPPSSGRILTLPDQGHGRVTRSALPSYGVSTAQDTPTIYSKSEESGILPSTPFLLPPPSGLVRDLDLGVVPWVQFVTEEADNYDRPGSPSSTVSVVTIEAICPAVPQTSPITRRTTYNVTGSLPSGGRAPAFILPRISQAVLPLDDTANEAIVYRRHPFVRRCFLAKHSKLGTIILKRPPMYRKDESDVWRTLNHDHILPFLGKCTILGDTYLGFPDVASHPIMEFLQVEPGLEMSERERLVQETASGLAYLHERKIKHGSVCTANILISGDRHALLSNFQFSVSDCTHAALRTDVFDFGVTIAEIVKEKKCRFWTRKPRFRRPRRPRPRDPCMFLWDIAEQCWESRPSLRPTIFELYKKLAAHANSLATQFHAAGSHLRPRSPPPPLSTFGYAAAPERSPEGGLHADRTASPSPGPAATPRRRTLHANTSYPKTALPDAARPPGRLDSSHALSSDRLAPPQVMPHDYDPSMRRLPSGHYVSRPPPPLPPPLSSPALHVPKTVGSGHPSTSAAPILANPATTPQMDVHVPRTAPPLPSKSHLSMPPSPPLRQLPPPTTAFSYRCPSPKRMPPSVAHPSFQPGAPSPSSPQATSISDNALARPEVNARSPQFSAAHSQQNPRLVSPAVSPQGDPATSSTEKLASVGRTETCTQPPSSQTLDGWPLPPKKRGRRKRQGSPVLKGKVKWETCVSSPRASTNGLGEMRYRRTEDKPFGDGGSSNVWMGVLMHHIGTTEQIAVKEVRVADLDPKATLERLNHEIRIWADFDHPNIVPLLGFTVDPVVRLISPWHKNSKISRFIEGHPDCDKLKLLEEVASGLEYLHTRQPVVIHGDIKLDNVLVNDDGAAALVDFGLRPIQEEVSPSAISSLRGTGDLRWMAPELLDDAIAKTTSSDVYSFGCLCLEVLTGQSPFKGIPNPTMVTVALASGTKPVADRHEYSKLEATDPLWEVMDTCWETEPSARLPIGALLAKIRETRRRAGTEEIGD